MIIATVIAIIMGIIMLSLAVVATVIEKKREGAQGEQLKSMTYEGILCDDIVIYDNQEQMIQDMIRNYTKDGVKEMVAIYFRKRGVVIEYKSGLKVYYTYSA